MSGTPSRIEEARHRALGAKQGAVALAAAGFLTVLILARGSHAGQSNTSSGSSGWSGAQAGEESSDDSFDFGSGSVAPSTSAPQVQTGVS